MIPATVINRVHTGHGIYYLLQSGEWIPGKGSRIGEYSSFEGLPFKVPWTMYFDKALALDIHNHTVASICPLAMRTGYITGHMRVIMFMSMILSRQIHLFITTERIDTW